MSRPTSSRNVWQIAFERRLLYLIALGGVATGLGVLAVSAPGFDGTDVLSLLALAIGIGAATNIMLDRTDPVPVLVLIVILVGTTAPFVDLALAMALSGVVIGVVATGSLLIERTQGVVALIGLGLVAVAFRPALDTLGYLSVEAAPMPASAPWIVSLVALMTTALGFRALRDQLVRKDAHQARINDLVENTAYQIKTPLTAAMGFAYLLRAELGDQVGAGYADGVIRRGWEVSLGLDDLMIVSRSETSDLEILERPVDVSSALESCLDNVIGARVKLMEIDATGSVLGDPVRVKQVLRHLVSNAVLHGGGEMWIRGRAQGRVYELRIHDNGTPLDEHQREEIFEPFHRLPTIDPKAGRGVGLTVSRILSAAMGGDLRIESAPDGNTAVLLLRTAPEPISGRQTDVVPAPSLTSIDGV